MLLKEKRKLTRLGNGVVVFLPKSWLKAFNLKAADVVNVELRKRGILITPSEEAKK